MAAFDGAFSDHLENDILRLLTNQTPSQLFAGVALTGWTNGNPSAFGLALHTAAPTNDSGTTGTPTEVASAGGYARIASSGQWAAPSGGSVANGSNARWPVSSQSSGSWGTVVGVGLWTSQTYGAGTFLAWMPLSVSYAVGSGSSFTVVTGALTLSIGGVVI